VKRTYPDGRIRVKTPTGWEWEHRLVMAAIVGRELVAGESVTHLNGDLGDNRPENLTIDTDACPACGAALGFLQRRQLMERGRAGRGARAVAPRAQKPGQRKLWRGAP
jgi:hypothetical protein